MNCEWLERIEKEHGAKKLKTTEKGLIFLQKYIALEDLLDGPAKRKIRHAPAIKIAAVKSN